MSPLIGKRCVVEWTTGYEADPGGPKKHRAEGAIADVGMAKTWWSVLVLFDDGQLRQFDATHVRVVGGSGSPYRHVQADPL